MERLNLNAGRRRSEALFLDVTPDLTVFILGRGEVG